MGPQCAPTGGVAMIYEMGTYTNCAGKKAQKKGGCDCRLACEEDTILMSSSFSPLQ
jgi:hypothetical protein